MDEDRFQRDPQYPHQSRNTRRGTGALASFQTRDQPHRDRRAHCASERGETFRPSYLKLGRAITTLHLAPLPPSPPRPLLRSWTPRDHTCLGTTGHTSSRRFRIDRTSLGRCCTRQPRSSGCARCLVAPGVWTTCAPPRQSRARALHTPGRQRLPALRARNRQPRLPAKRRPRQPSRHTVCVNPDANHLSGPEPAGSW
jgi:hypothetical protein